MKQETYAYAIGDIIKTRKMPHLEDFNDRPMVVVERLKTHGYNEYKVIVCGYENQFRYFIQDDIAGKLEEIKNE